MISCHFAIFVGIQHLIFLNVLHLSISITNGSLRFSEVLCLHENCKYMKTVYVSLRAGVWKALHANFISCWRRALRHLQDYFIILL